VIFLASQKYNIRIIWLLYCPTDPQPTTCQRMTAVSLTRESGSTPRRREKYDMRRLFCLIVPVKQQGPESNKLEMDARLALMTGGRILRESGSLQAEPRGEFLHRHPLTVLPSGALKSLTTSSQFASVLVPRQRHLCSVGVPSEGG
jgi:hypothetical protein